ncbi:MAG TPA: YdcF family protein [Steroidobacteraceae bacterium]|nr:YdcF family protein [Steroidobacteraceae bacterium]
MDVFIWKIVLKNLVLPPTGPLLLALAGLALTLGRRRRSVGLALCATGVVLLWLLATPLVADTLVRWAEKYPALDLRKSVGAQAVVILAGGVRVDAPEYGGSAPGATTLERLVYGARVARATGLPILVSGSRYEAAAMEEFLRRDLALKATWVENRSRDTHENARKSAVILAQAGVHRVLLVTSAAHMARSVTEFEQAGITVTPAPAAMWTLRDRGITGWIPNADALTRSQRALYEALGRLVLAARHGLIAIGVVAAEPPLSGRV